MERASKPTWATPCGCKMCNCPTPLREDNAVLASMPDEHDPLKTYWFWVCVHCAQGEHHSGEI